MWLTKIPQPLLHTTNSSFGLFCALHLLLTHRKRFWDPSGSFGLLHRSFTTSLRTLYPVELAADQILTRRQDREWWLVRLPVWLVWLHFTGNSFGPAFWKWESYCNQRKGVCKFLLSDAIWLRNIAEVEIPVWNQIKILEPPFLYATPNLTQQPWCLPNLNESIETDPSKRKVLDYLLLCGTCVFGWQSNVDAFQYRNRSNRTLGNLGGWFDLRQIK